MDFEERVPGDHPICSIKALARSALERLSPEFDPMYPKVGRASVPPGRLLKASLLIPLYPAVSERAFCDELEYRLLFEPVSEAGLLVGGAEVAVHLVQR